MYLYIESEKKDTGTQLNEVIRRKKGKHNKKETEGTERRKKVKEVEKVGTDGRNNETKG